MHARCNAQFHTQPLHSLLPLVFPDHKQMCGGQSGHGPKQLRQSFSLEARPNEKIKHRFGRNPHSGTHSQSLGFEPRVENIKINTVINNVQLFFRRSKVAADFVANHFGVADHRPQPWAFEQAPFRRQKKAVVWVQRESDTACGPQHARPVFQPLRMHAVTGTIHIAAGNALMGLHKVKFPFGKRPAHGARETPVAPCPPQKKRLASHQLRCALPDGTVTPVSRKHRYGHAFVRQRGHGSGDEALRPTVGVIPLPDNGEFHARGHRAMRRIVKTT